MVEPSPTRRLHFAHLAGLRGLRAVFAGTGEEALAMAETLQPDLVAIDGAQPDAGAVLADLHRRDPALSVILAGLAAATPGGPDVRVHRVADSGAIVDLAARLMAGGQAGRSCGEPWREAAILVIDDSVTYREYLRLELEEAGWPVVAVAGANAAMAALAETTFGAVIIDLVMPGTNGNRLCSSLDRLRRRRGLTFSIIVHTSQEDETQLLTSLAAGADEFIGKSQSMDVFRARMTAVLRRRYYSAKPQEIP
jgi:DNA-binding response OmpR family regulator